jgi:hypothetical protein
MICLVAYHHSCAVGQVGVSNNKVERPTFQYVERTFDSAYPPRVHNLRCGVCGPRGAVSRFPLRPTGSSSLLPLARFQFAGHTQPARIVQKIVNQCNNRCMPHRCNGPPEMSVTAVPARRYSPRDAEGRPVKGKELSGGFEFEDGVIGHVVGPNKIWRRPAII